jgi:hypothetical protein
VLTIGQSIIFMQHVKSAKWLAAQMEKLGHKVESFRLVRENLLKICCRFLFCTAKIWKLRND